MKRYSEKQKSNNFDLTNSKYTSTTSYTYLSEYRRETELKWINVILVKLGSHYKTAQFGSVT